MDCNAINGIGYSNCMYKHTKGDDNLNTKKFVRYSNTMRIFVKAYLWVFTTPAKKKRKFSLQIFYLVCFEPIIN